MQKASDVEYEYNNHFKYLQSPQMQQKRQELKQQEEELRELEQTLGMCFYHCRLVFLMHSMLVMQYCILKYWEFTWRNYRLSTTVYYYMT